VVEEPLRRAGSSSGALLEQLAGLGYEAHAISHERSRLRQRLRLDRVGAADAPIRSDVLFLHGNGRASVEALAPG
jgi:hypothetical protein